MPTDVGVLQIGGICSEVLRLHLQLSGEGEFRHLPLSELFMHVQQLNRNVHIPYVYMYMYNTGDTCTDDRLIARKLNSSSLFPDFNLLCQVDEVLLYSVQIDGLVGSLETCEYRQATFRELLDQLQKMIDDLNLRSYSNLTQWVSELDKQVWFCHQCTFSVLLPDNYACLFPRNKLEMSFRSCQLVWSYHVLP